MSYLGYETQFVTVGSASVYTITLQEDKKLLDEVVVTALGIKRSEKALGYSVQKIGGEDLSIVKGSEVATALTGKIAGLAINNSNEISEKPTVLLRGETPLLVIDGVAYHNMSLSDLSAEDIESIDVLKGATASALYGVQGRNGAIMVTTKRSGKEGTLQVNVSNNTMATIGYLNMPKVQHSYSSGWYGEMSYYGNGPWGDYMDGHEAMQWDPEAMELRMMPLLPRGKNNLKNFFQSGLMTNTNINISQSGKHGGFRVSTTHTLQKGQIPNTKVNKFMVNAAGNIHYGKFSLDAGLSYKKELAPNMPRASYGNGNLYYTMIVWTGCEWDVRDYKNYWKVKDQQQNWMYNDWYDNPYFMAHESIEKQDNNVMTANATATYDILPNIQVMLRSGYDQYTNNTTNRISKGQSENKNGYYAYNTVNGSSFNNDLIIKGDFKIKDFGIDAIAGLSSSWWKNKQLQASTQGGLSVPGYYSLDASVEKPNVYTATREKALYGAYFKLGLSWKEGVYVDVTGRNDWSSTLPSSSRSYFYPSVAGSVLPTAFYNPISNVLDFWKLRASWTQSKSDLGVYESNMAYGVNSDLWHGLNGAYYPTSLRDPNIKPETDNAFEIGTNLRFFKGRLSFDYAFFRRKRYNILTNADVSLGSGFSGNVTNTSEERIQRGQEYTLSGIPIDHKNFTWESSLNISWAHWYYGNIDPVFSSQDPRKGKGERVDKYFFTDWERDPEGNMVHQGGFPVKNKFQSVIGNRDAKFVIGFTNTFRYKNIDLAISVDGRIGGKMYSWTEEALWTTGAHPDSDNKWRYDEVVNHKNNYIGKGVKIVSGTLVTDPYGKVLSDDRVFAPNDVETAYSTYTMRYNPNPWDLEPYQNIKDASFIKLREVAVNYRLPSSFVHKLGMKEVKVGAVGQNLWMWTKGFKYSDPDRGWENMNMPTQMYLGCNVNITF